MNKKILLLPGDGIGPEVLLEARLLLEHLRDRFGLSVEFEEGDIGGIAVDRHRDPLPSETLEKAQAADAVLLGAVGGPQWDALPNAERPERGLLRIRSGLGLFANLRPAMTYPQLAHASSLKPELVAGLDMMIVRELTGGIYFGEPRGIFTDNGERRGINTLVYREHEIVRIARAAFDVAAKRSRRVCSVDKANVLESTQLWRDVVMEVAVEYPEIELTHMYVDNAAMQLIRQPKQFDVIVTTNMFGDILSDAAAMLTGSIGMLPSASLDAQGKGLYEPVHGSAPDIAGQNIANPLATLLSVAMMLRYSLDQPDLADRIQTAVNSVLERGLRTRDLGGDPDAAVGTREMGAAVIEAL
ncbi:MAG: 3-isopropylmalate dehydrogenase [Gammaproteobacteria bacterium]|nr:3-isopropylmalate dehydrogenase [Gammaproteobacteria bacterium]MDH3380079.1 3-isopropylmalate dehydrogenase [Gammaproteobacteria bacterium]